MSIFGFAISCIVLLLLLCKFAPDKNIQMTYKNKPPHKACKLIGTSKMSASRYSTGKIIYRWECHR